MERKGIYSIEEVKNVVLPILQNKKETRIICFYGDNMKANSQRYQLFFTKGMKCVKCGIEGKYFAKERSDRNSEKYHFNLYALDEKGNEILMTKNHIIPKSKGGKNTIDNYQTMCVKCNKEKGNK